jgi:hypothetical protein
MLKPSPESTGKHPHLAHVSHIFSQKKHGAVSFSTPAISFSSSAPGAPALLSWRDQGIFDFQNLRGFQPEQPMRSVILNGSVDLNLKANIV